MYELHVRSQGSRKSLSDFPMQKVARLVGQEEAGEGIGFEGLAVASDATDRAKALRINMIAGRRDIA